MKRYLRENCMMLAHNLGVLYRGYGLMGRMGIYRSAKILATALLVGAIALVSRAQAIARLQSAGLDEVSGLVVGGNNLLYVHNDSGDRSRFYAIDLQGKLVSTLYFTGDSRVDPLGVVDCEDISFGPGPKPGKNYIYLGDIGDNPANRPYLTIYSFLEPNRLSLSMKLDASVLHVKYPDGPQDAETMLVDPISKELVIISKREGKAGIYSTPLLFESGDTVVLKRKGELFSSENSPLRYVVGGDISRDGKKVLLKTYEKVFYWGRRGNEPIWHTLQRKPVELPYLVEAQGKAIGFTPDGRGYYCIGEGKQVIIYRYHTGPANSNGQR